MATGTLRPTKHTATRDRRPAPRPGAAIARDLKRPARVVIPRRTASAVLEIEGLAVTVTNTGKPFWPDLGITKGDLLQYYADVSAVLLPHLRDRAMVMKRYPNGAAGEFFFMKRTPPSAPEWLETCPIEHSSGSVIHFPLVQNLASLLWVVNLGCIDLNQWYALCDDVYRPDCLHFDLDPGEGADFEQVREASLIIGRALAGLDMPAMAKTTGSKGIHVYVPIQRGPTQKEVWTVAKALAKTLAEAFPGLLTAEYRIAKRPHGRVLVDYNQNAWGRTLASVYSVRPRPLATVSTPVTWEELEAGARLEDFTLRNVPERITLVGDLWSPMLTAAGRFRLESLA